MIVGVDIGHTLSGAGTGAAGYVKETDKNREVGRRLIQMLRDNGHSVVDCTVDYSSNDLADRVKKANAQRLDLFVSLHLNAYKKTIGEMGVETHIYNGSWEGKESNRKKAKEIQSHLVSMIGWKDRGVKESNFHVLRETTAPAVLVELGFCDSQGDMDKWNTERIAAALFKGITGKEYTQVESQNQTFKVGDRVMVSKNATTYATGQSMASFVKGSVYTVVEAKSNMALLSDITSWVYSKDLTKVDSPAPQPPAFTSYKARVEVDVLNVREGAGTGYRVSTTIKKGEVYTIVNEKSGWGQLKSGAGWVSLDYVKKV